jgi:excisionase family DNA binding protein
MVDPVSISQAAVVLGLSASRVRAMAVRGQLSAVKLGDRWFVERADVERRRREGALEGRRFSPRNAWALLLLASSEEVRAVDPSVRSRLKRALNRDGLENLGPRLARRAEVRTFGAHPGEIAHLLADPQLVCTGISAAGAEGFDLVSGLEADGYLGATQMPKFVARHALEPAGPGGNVRLRIVPKEAEDFLDGMVAAPRAAVALDLADEFDARSAAAGKNALRELDRTRREERQTSLQSGVA